MRSKSLAVAAGAAFASSTMAQTLPTVPAISFFWATPGLVVGNFAIPSCSSVVISLARNENAGAPVPPFHFIAAPVGGVPESQLVTTSIGGRFAWNANFPAGTSFVITMTDSAGNSGGSVGPYTMVTGTNNCTLANNITPITFTSNPPDDPCGEVDLTITGGIKPYTVSVLAPGIGLFGNLTGQTNDVKLGNSVANSQDFFMFVTDSLGNSSTVSNATTSRLGDTTCVKPIYPSNSSSPSIGAIVGGVVGGILGAITLLGIAFFFLRRKKASQAIEDQRQDELNTSAEYRMADGNAPRVTPFLVPGRVPSSDPQAQGRNQPLPPIAYNSSTPTINDSPSPLPSPLSPTDYDSQQSSYHSSHPASSQYSHAPILPYPGQHTPPPPLPSPYHSYERPSSVASDPRTGLDHPDGFQYRDAPGQNVYRAQRSRSELYD